MACGHCAAVCPRDAITLAQNDGDTATTAPTASQAASSATRDNPAYAAILSHRSFRAYSGERVSRDFIERAIDAARYAPSGKNAHGIEWTVVEGRDTVREAGRSLTDRLRKVPERASRYKYITEGEDAVFWGASALVVVHGDPAASLIRDDGVIAATVFDYAAQSLGLATCMSGTAQNAPDLIRDLAGIPAGHDIYAVIMVGLPAERFLRLPARPIPRVTWR
jgi:nitroreductase